MNKSEKISENAALGRRIVEARKAAGFTSGNEFSEAIGVSVVTLSNYETGKRSPRAEELIKIREVTGADLNWLIVGKGSGPTSSEPSQPEEGNESPESFKLSGELDWDAWQQAIDQTLRFEKMHGPMSAADSSKMTYRTYQAIMDLDISGD